jgi:hypothetical protein
LLAALIGGMAAGAKATAGELLVMPFACSVVAGQPVLRPSSQEGHSVIGRREQRVFRACSPVNPGLCQQWTIHRFDFDCNGAAVPWLAAVAAAEGHRNRMWVQDGRLHLRMPPAWNFAADHPCARAPYHGDRWRPSRLDRYCAERAALAPALVELPPGFAPAFGLDAIFVPAPLPQGSQRPADQAAGPAKGAETSAANQPEPAPKTPALKAPPPTAKQPPDARERTAAAVPPAEPSTARPPPVVPRIINRPPTSGPAAGPQADPTADPAQTTAKQTSAPPRVFAPPSISTEETVVKGAASRSQLPAGGSPPSASLFTSTGLSVATISVGLLVLGFTVGLAILFTRRRDHVALTAMATRDIASVALDTSGGRGALTVVAPHAGGSAVEPSAPRPPPSPRPSSWGRHAPALVESGRIPQTREEALQVLGMGVGADASPTAIKKIVDGLRLSWHPDLAVDQSDRGIRELRLKQINAAWQLLGASRPG